MLDEWEKKAGDPADDRAYAAASDRRRVDLTFGIGYADDVGKAEAVLTKLVSEHPLVLADPAPVIKLNELADSSVNFVVRPWTKTGDYWTVSWDLMKGVKQAFDHEGFRSRSRSGTFTCTRRERGAAHPWGGRGRASNPEGIELEKTV